MKFPTYTSQQFTKEDGFLTPPMQDYNDLLAQELANGLSDNGWTVPQITAADLVKIAPTMPNGTIWALKDNVPQLLIVKLDDTLHKVTTTAYP